MGKISPFVIGIFQGQRLFYNGAYYFGVSPFSMDSNYVLRPINSVAQWVRYFLTTSIILLSNDVVLAAFALGLYNGEVKITRTDDVGGLLNWCMMGMTSFLHCHTFLKRVEIVDLANSFNTYFQIFAEFPTHMQKRKRISIHGSILKLCFLAGMSVPFLGVMAFIVRCKWNIYAPIAPGICVAKYSPTTATLIGWKHGPLEDIPLLAFLHLIGVSACVAGTFVYFAIAFPIILASMDIVKTMGSIEPGDYFHSHVNWIRHYRAFQLLAIKVNGVMQDYYAPALSFVLPAMIVISNYILIRFDLSFATFAYFLILNIILILVFMMAYNFSVNLFKQTDDALAARKTMEHLSKFNQADLNGLRYVTVYIGSVHKFDEETRIILFSAVQNYTLDLLISFPN